ncbi:MAG: TIGR01212 family radical SAM protein, partial [Aquificae bacterium]|nr:TIGR01212 family radical SAM protein [Aquificota bacterium]
LELLESYTEKGLEVWIEYGLQSANFGTLKRINRQHGVSDFVDAVLRTKKKPLKVCAHMIVGLPGEGVEDFLETAKLIAALPIDGIKIHPLHVIRGTVLAKEYEEGKFRTLSLEEYARAVARILELLPPAMVIQRLTGETDEERLVAPEWCTFRKKNEVLQKIRKTLEEMGSYQGKKYPFWRYEGVR